MLLVKSDDELQGEDLKRTGKCHTYKNPDGTEYLENSILDPYLCIVNDKKFEDGNEYRLQLN